MPPKRFGPAADPKARAQAKARARHSALIRTALGQGRGVEYAPSGVGRVDGLSLTDARGGITPAGVAYQDVQRERGEDPSLDPFVRGTQRSGKTLYAQTRRGDRKAVARFDGGDLVPTKGAGERYWGAFREELMIEFPAFHNVRGERDRRGR